MGYDEESKGYQLYFPKRHHIAVERDVYFDKDTVVDVGDVVFEGEREEPPTKLDFSNPTLTNNNNTSAPETLDPDLPEITPEMALIPPVTSQSPIPPKPRRNSLTGLPQYDLDQYGRGRTRRTATRPG